MSHTRFQPQLLALFMATAGLLTACGGGGASTATPNATTTTLKSGTISGLGSIIVNGVRYETVGSQVLDADDGSTAITTPLRMGMTVSVEQSSTDLVTQRPIAGKILVQSGIIGVASSTSSTLTVAGMPITTNASTILLDTTGAVITNLATLNNQNVEVYGLPQADGSFLATLVEAKTSALNVQVVGTVQSIDATAKTLVLGTTAAPITVSYASITPPSGLAIGTVIVAKTAVTATASTYTASSLQIRSATVSTYVSYASDYSGTTGVSTERNELYGAVSGKAAAGNNCTFHIQGIQVQVSNALSLCTSITDGTYVEAKGTLSNGVLNATNIQFEGSQSNGYSDDLNDANGDGLRYRNLSTLGTSTELQASRSFEMYGSLSCSAVNTGCTLTRGTITYTVDMSSAYWGGSQSIVNGYVEAQGYLTGNTFKVSKIESKDRRYVTGTGIGNSTGNGDDD